MNNYVVITHDYKGEPQPPMRLYAPKGAVEGAVIALAEALWRRSANRVARLEVHQEKEDIVVVMLRRAGAYETRAVRAGRTYRVELLQGGELALQYRVAAPEGAAAIRDWMEWIAEAANEAYPVAE